ncbi:hypothetical protein AAFF_G00188840 [Aldrovandia affinis]|uniref:Uncharacterized protein n=1 Tax=Aldrovandia affinis TaxID=143900 RepID=A0AAD7SY34_9TELE|nr:hypothetical protein AAFF_G00188840 [Aldrovandia affinis]
MQKGSCHGPCPPVSPCDRVSAVNTHISSTFGDQHDISPRSDGESNLFLLWACRTSEVAQLPGGAAHPFTGRRLIERFVKVLRELWGAAEERCQALVGLKLLFVLGCAAHNRFIMIILSQAGNVTGCRAIYGTGAMATALRRPQRVFTSCGGAFLRPAAAEGWAKSHVAPRPQGPQGDRVPVKRPSTQAVSLK